MVFQDLALWPHMSVKGNIEFGLKVKGVPKREREEKIQRVLEEMELAGLEERKPSQLSGGQQQRVALARTVVTEPEIVLMDEPLSSLDEELNVRLRREIVQMQERSGFTLIYVTHSKDEAADIGERIVKLKRGTIVFDGSLDTLIQN